MLLCTLVMCRVVEVERETDSGVTVYVLPPGYPEVEMMTTLAKCDGLVIISSGTNDILQSRVVVDR